MHDSFIIILKSTQTYGFNVANTKLYREFVSSYATPEVMAEYEQEWEETAEQERKEEEENARKMKQAEEEKLAHRLLYNRWKALCDSLFNGTALITRFPHLPVDICTCDIQVCGLRKVDKLLLACRHDVEKLLKASGQYSLAWLRTERLAWHPDRFGRKCSPEYKDLLLKKATEMYTIFEELIVDAAAG